MQKYHTAVFIGRFQPFHLAHLSVVEQALQYTQQVVIILGSTLQCREPKNPFSLEERKDYIARCLTDKQKQRVVIEACRDYHDLDRWVKRINVIVKQYVANQSICMIGHRKDAGSYFLDLFPNWGLIELNNVGQINATDIRYHYFAKQDLQVVAPLLPPAMLDYLEAFRHTEDYQTLCASYH